MPELCRHWCSVF